MRKHVLILLLLTLTLAACRQTKKTHAADSALASQPIVAVDDDVSIDDTDADNIKDNIDKEVEITPDTELYFIGIQKSDIASNSFKTFQDPNCIRRIKLEGIGGRNIFTYYPRDFLGDAIVLAKIGKITKHEYCENGKLSKYNTYYTKKATILHTFFGPINKGEIELISSGPAGFIQGRTYLLVLKKTKYGDYTTRKNIALFLEKKDLSSWLTITPSELESCQIIDLPTKISKLNDTFRELNSENNKVIDREGIFNEFRQLFESRLGQTHGEPGEPCNIEEDEKRKHEEYMRWSQEQEKEMKEIEEYTAGKKVPCDTCPLGYEVEDLEVGEYIRKLNEIEKIIEERKNND